MMTLFRTLLMRSRGPAAASRSIIALLLANATIAPAVARADTIDLWLWDADLYDADGDGYAKFDTNLSLRQLISTADGVTPDGWVEKRGDLNDNDADVHPRRPEVYGNGIDDNCNGRADEPEIKYFPSGNANTSNAFTMEVQINDPAVVSVWNSRTALTGLYYVVEYQNLHDTATTLRTAKTRVTSLDAYPSSARTSIRLTGLSSGQVYRARVQFYRASIGPNSAIGKVSDWYYTTTDSNSDLGHARTRAVLRGCYEYYLSRYLGYVGYLGQTYEDGTRYGADLGEAWCSEFYSWVWRSELADLPTEISYWGELIDYFDGYDAFELGLCAVFEATRGDYLAVYDGNWNISHSCMFLAYDTSTGQYWTLNGNGESTLDWSGTAYEGYMNNGYSRLGGGDEVDFFAFDACAIAGWGEIQSSMLR